MIRETTRKAASGYLALLVLPVLTIIFIWLFVTSVIDVLQIFAGSLVPAALYLVALIAVHVCYRGFFMVHPNQAKVLQLNGHGDV